MRWWLAGILFVGCVGPGLPDGGGASRGADASVHDPWPHDAGHPNAGTCTLVPQATPEALAKSPRARPDLELLVLLSNPELFVLDDATYARAVADLAVLDMPQVATPSTDLETLLFYRNRFVVGFDAEGQWQLGHGQYDWWDCLNAAYGATHDGTFLRFTPVISWARVIPEYAALPHVISFAPVAWGRSATCGANVGLCISVDSATGTWTWIGAREKPTCGGNAWFRMRTYADGGVEHETRLDGGFEARDWLDEAPKCWDALSGQNVVAPRDAGP